MDRDCYCRPDQTHCGICSICNSPGHISHHPGGIPFTGSWCDMCYQTMRLANIHLMDHQIPSE